MWWNLHHTLECGGLIWTLVAWFQSLFSSGIELQWFVLHISWNCRIRLEVFSFASCRPWNEETLDTACKLILDEISLPASAPGGKVEYKRTLMISFLFKFYLAVSKILKKMVNGADNSLLPDSDGYGGAQSRDSSHLPNSWTIWKMGQLETMWMFWAPIRLYVDGCGFGVEFQVEHRVV